MESKRSILLFFASVSPEGISTKRKKERIRDYSTSLEIIWRYSNKLNFDICVIENTLGSQEKWVNLQLFSGEKIKFLYLNENSGLTNKGLGELDMATFALSHLDLQQYNKVIWFSGRHLLTSEAILTNCVTTPAEAIISNPDFYFLNGQKIETEKNGLINDMIFAMSTKLFSEYILKFSESREELVRKGLGSEQNLFQFVTERDPTAEWMEHIGVLRRENRLKWRYIETSEWHFC
jgi:hypothetical protein